ncbi:FAD-binding domain-containing protein [Teratosphaeria nubilosa]|uniref:FAD-binding domain-containing protein n=1 Tax=Teratosphaeria nubilosa TaxID=161662 RepID=A0A6G1LAQ5_9PEZI|nr:FAD-binding domain-containing protein [Teratosphaeria nubilosa]
MLRLCSELHAKYPAQIVFDSLGPDSLETLSIVSEYTQAITGYWDVKNMDTWPACSFLPSNADDTSFAVKTLLKYPSVRFALKGGGHNLNVGWSSVGNGVLIAFRPNSKYATPAADSNTIDVGAGCKFEDVYEVLTPLKKTVVSARLGDIDVDGFISGGGLSYLSSQYGFAADNVVSAEVVLANGTITNASATFNPDLFFALKGGGNQYAIVTKWTLNAFDSGTDGLVWGGNKDPKAAMIPTFNFAGFLVPDVPVAIVFLFYDASTPVSGIFDAIDAIPHLYDSTKARTVYDLTRGVLVAIIKVPQQITTLIAQASQIAGGNALGLDPNNGDRMFIKSSLAWASPLCDKTCPSRFKQWVSATHDLHVQDFSGNHLTNYKSGDLEYISYGHATYQLLKAVHEAYDPTNFFGSKQGGWNFTSQ